MAKYTIPYAVLDGEAIVFESEVEVSFTKKDIAELEQFVIDHNYSWEFVDIPAHMYDKCMNKAFETGVSKFNGFREKGNSYEVYLGNTIPYSLYETLSEETRDKVLANIPEDYLEDDEEEEEVVPTKENTLYLTMKQVYFDKIMSGEKKEEYREIKGTTFKKFLAVDEEGEPYINTDIFPKDKWENYPYEMIFNIFNDGHCPLVAKDDLCFLNLAVGYNKVRDTATVEVVDITFEPAKNKQGDDCRFRVGDNGEPIADANGQYCIWNAVLHLGRIVEKNIVSH